MSAALKERGNALLLWAVCTLFIPLLWVMQLLQALFGSPDRAHKMAVAIDENGNALFGGDPGMSISCRTGLALKANSAWAERVAPCIDFFFGKNHCINTANEISHN